MINNDDGLVEAVARAICSSEGIDPDKQTVLAPTIYMMTMDEEWDNGGEGPPEWTEWKPHAVAAIAAIRAFEEKRS